jgi:hypothetical protein
MKFLISGDWPVTAGLAILPYKITIMTRTEIESSLQELNGLVLQGRMMDAFEKFYHEDVSMQENELAPTVSKKLNRQRELEFYDAVTEFRGARVEGLGVGDNISFVIWHYDYTHKDWGVKNYSQVSIQEWKDGQIIREKFVYGA